MNVSGSGSNDPFGQYNVWGILVYKQDEKKEVYGELTLSREYVSVGLNVELNDEAVDEMKVELNDEEVVEMNDEEVVGSNDEAVGADDQEAEPDDETNEREGEQGM